LIRDMTFGILVSTEMNITETLVAIVPCFLAAGLGFALFCFVRHLNTMRTAAADLEVASSPERYRPMLRLLDERDFQYLAESGCPKEVVRKAKADRRAIFRRYLRCLVKDYSRLLAGLRMQILMSKTDRPDLLRAIAANRWFFLRSLVRIELSLALHTAGIGKVDVSGLVQAIEGLTAVSGSFAPTTA
jgi:hypothetical protein